LIFEATATSHAIGAQVRTAASDLRVDDITLYEVTPGYVAADAVGPDTMTKTATLDVHQYLELRKCKHLRIRNYNLKLTKGADSAEYLNFGTALNYRQAQGEP